jgi:hypothetical protein
MLEGGLEVRFGFVVAGKLNEDGSERAAGAGPLGGLGGYRLI